MWLKNNFQFSIFNFQLFLLLCFLSCTAKKADFHDAEMPDSTLQVQYAEGFAVSYFPHYKRVDVFDPWRKGKVYMRYYLVKNNEFSTSKDGQKVVIPLQKIAATSCTHFEFLQLLDEINSIKAVCSPHLIYNAALREKYAAGDLEDLGDAFSVNIEKTQYLNPDALFLSGFSQEQTAGNRLIENGITVVYNNEWMENSLLARAEWLKFVAVFYDKETAAKTLFDNIAAQYNALKTIVENVPVRPTVLTGGNFGGTWYMPGGMNYMARLFADAGGNYFYAKNRDTGSLPLNFEQVLKHFHNADVWVGTFSNSLDELARSDERNILFSAMKNKQVYNFNNRYLSDGANDFWESGIANPHWILADMIKALHPALLPEHEFVYVKKLD